jgi:hypothetical protein
MRVSHIDRPIEGLRCFKGGHWRSQRAIGEDGRPAMVCVQSAPRDEGRSRLARRGSPYTRGRGMRPAHALSPRPMIGKEHESITRTHPTTRILTPRKVIVRRQLMVLLSSSDDDLSLVKHDAWVDLKPGGMRIRYT